MISGWEDDPPCLQSSARPVQVQRVSSFWKRLFRRRNWILLRRLTLRRAITATNTRGAAKAEIALSAMMRIPPGLVFFAGTPLVVHRGMRAYQSIPH